MYELAMRTALKNTCACSHNSITKSCTSSTTNVRIRDYSYLRFRSLNSTTICLHPIWIAATCVYCTHESSLKHCVRQLFRAGGGSFKILPAPAGKDFFPKF
mmetsp:Transcript_626/g.1004  ORF Transcript_626/g.1004 Transcript_626/m.1004 type:complete len:101 (+) Transcript_626:155-457(+)